MTSSFMTGADIRTDLMSAPDMNLLFMGGQCSAARMRFGMSLCRASRRCCCISSRWLNTAVSMLPLQQPGWKQGTCIPCWRLLHPVTSMLLLGSAAAILSLQLLGCSVIQANTIKHHHISHHLGCQTSNCAMDCVRLSRALQPTDN